MYKCAYFADLIFTIQQSTLKITKIGPLKISRYIVISQVYLVFMYRLSGNNISDAGAQALAEGLQHCINLYACAY